ncbi:hypothetical protein ACFLYO_10290 [Chloroflexota bacterium]
MLWTGLLLGLLMGQMALAAPPEQDATPFVEPVGCQQPSDDYARVWVGNAQFNVRTLAMLDHAETLYHQQGGMVDFRPAVTQGGYNPGGVAASFGTHDGGGAVDISVRSRVDWSVLTDEIAPMLAALRTAGFAAWLRDPDELYAGSPIHIHAIAVGDREATPIAQAQVDGPFGYLRGWNGLPPENGEPLPDLNGPPVICQWMRDLGYDDWRSLPGGVHSAKPDKSWRKDALMGFLRRMLGGKSADDQSPKQFPTGHVATPGQMLDALEQDRANAEHVLLTHFEQCTACGSDYLRVGAWTRQGEAGWTVSCVNCGQVLERTLEIAPR